MVMEQSGDEPHVDVVMAEHVGFTARTVLQQQESLEAASAVHQTATHFGLLCNMLEAQGDECLPDICRQEQQRSNASPHALLPPQR